MHSHKETVNFQHKAFPFYEDLCLIYGKDHATGKNAQAPVDAIEKIERTRVCKEAEGENLNFEGVQDNMDDSMFISHAPKKCPTTANNSSRKGK